jgi:hypothetical protein
MIQYRVDQTNEQVRTESEIHSSIGRSFRILGICYIMISDIMPFIPTSG